ncbi:MAG: response regulator [Deltaproteobacteria bacterium]|nr:response regulator [Deltaproteobacteria bacterium]
MVVSFDGKIGHKNDGSFKQTHCVLQDITAHKRADEVLLGENRLSEEYINSLPGLFYVFNEQTFVKWNSEWERVTGYSSEELATKYGTDFFEGEDRILIGERMLKVFNEGVADAEAELVTKDGRRIPYYFTGMRKKLDGKDHLIGLGIDITERKRAEEEKLTLERQMQQAQKLESLGVLAGGIAHDFNNLLMGILGNADLAMLDLAPESPIRANILDIEMAANRAADLAKQMLAYSGKGRFVVQKLDLQTIVQEMVHLLEVSISKKAVVKYDFAQNVPPIEADTTQIRQIIMNLVVNASEAIGNRSGVISIRTGVMECDQAYFDETFVDETYFDNNLSANTYSYFEISDTGSGMDKETSAKIFDPFFSTKFTGRGLGLAAVLGIVRGHSGAIKVYSELNKGTTFKILFPSTDGRLSSSSKLEIDKLDLKNLKGKVVLLVDDEETIRIVGRQMLEVLDMEVVTAKHGREALKLFKKDPDRFDCIILDLTMPYMDGEETFREMSRVRGDIRVILSSGYNEQDLMTRFAGKGLAGFIQKPYQTTDIAKNLLNAFSNKTHTNLE